MTNIEKIINSVFGLMLHNNDNAASYVHDLCKKKDEDDAPLTPINNNLDNNDIVNRLNKAIDDLKSNNLSTMLGSALFDDKFLKELDDYVKEQKRLEEAQDVPEINLYHDDKPWTVLKEFAKLTEFANMLNKLIEVNKKMTTTTTEAPTTTTTCAPKPSQSNLISDEYKKKFRECADRYVADILSKEIKEECLLDKIADGLYEYTCWLYTDAR